MGATIAEKILGRHADGQRVKAGDVVVARVDFAMVHDARAANALKAIDRLRANQLPFATASAFVLDHYSPPPNVEAANTHAAMRAFANRNNAKLYDVGDGICHQVLPEGGHFTCGDLVVGTDTHSTTYGAFNALGIGVEGTDLAAVLATGRNWFRVPETIRVDIAGRLQPGVWAKDVTLWMLGRLGAEGANYRAIEYAGPAVSAMDIDDRMTLANHAAELGAKAAVLEADAKTFEWLAAHSARPPQPVSADPDARYDERIALDAATLAPQVARRHKIDDVVAVSEAAGLPVNVALIGTCTNGRLDDIRQAAAILNGQRLARGVRLIVTPASREIYLAAEREGLLEVLTRAGASVDAAGCGTCVGITHKLIPADGEIVLSSANRNFRGRLGNAGAEILDRLVRDGRGLGAHRPADRPARSDRRHLEGGMTQAANGLAPVRGRAHVMGDNVNTDIHCSNKYRHIGKDIAFLKEHAFEEIDATLAGRIQPGDVLVAGTNFGINSSREQAVQVLKAMGIAAIVARSFGRNFFRNCINNGLLVVNCPIDGIAPGDEVEIDLAAGRVNVPAKQISRPTAALPDAVQAILFAGGLIPFLQQHPEWNVQPS